MPTDTVRRLRLLALFGVTSLAFFAVSLWLLFKAGCAGDTKGGSHGDPLVALHLENAALPFFLLAIIGIIILIASVTPLLVRYRVASIVLFVLVGAPALWLTGLRVESWGLRNCYPDISWQSGPPASRLGTVARISSSDSR